MAVEVRGQSRTYVRIGDEGNRATFHFCPECGSTVHWRLEGLDDLVYVPVGAFADPTFPSPSVSVYEIRKHAWVSLPATIEAMP